jgi:riboflavin transporter FmnP
VTRRLISVAMFLEVGLLLMVLPWSGFWDRNYFGMALPALQPILTNNFVRGAVSGLGVVNLLAGVTELSLLFAGRERRDGP